MNLEKLYAESDLYTSRIVDVITQAGLLNDGEDDQLRSYLEETSRGEKYV